MSKFEVAFARVCGAVLLSVVAVPAFSKNEAVELLKYLNPIQEKGYVNEKQDRLIKKKSFKASELPNIEPAWNKEIGLFAEVNPKEIDNPAAIENLLAKPNVNGL